MSQAQINQILEQLDHIKKTLEPISETYNTVIQIGKWSKVGLGFLLLIISLVLGIKQIFK